ncbi:MAG: PadR family transcriptional regulator [Candidatus Nomurabacteria bacterium]|jgi:PadR family transcriptional regulator PadR|nr:PadR family transcriptional regulator [Candidatus Nomurabacteria bacterium]
MQTIIEQTESAADYAGELTVQLKKGVLTQCVLLVTEEPRYASEILQELNSVELDIVEGTVYPLLSRLSRNGLLRHKWHESPAGPPRKYYQITDYGREVREHLAQSINKLNNTVSQLERK